MPFMTRRILAASAAALIVAAGFAAAQAQQMSSPMAPATPPVRIRATIETVSGDMLTAKARDGAELKVKLAANAPVNEVVPVSLADIKDNSYIAVTAMPQPDGSQKAVAILIFPEAMRGVGGELDFHLGAVACLHGEVRAIDAFDGAAHAHRVGRLRQRRGRRKNCGDGQRSAQYRLSHVTLLELG